MSLHTRPITLAVHVDTTSFHVQGPHREGKGLVGLLGQLQEELRHPHRIQAVQHPPHAVVVEEVRRDTSPMRSRMPATKPRWPRSYTCRSGVASIPKS